MTICCNKPENWNGFQLYDIILTLHLLLVVVASNSSSSLHHFNSIFFVKLHERLCYDKSDASQVVRLSRHFKRLIHRNTLERPAVCKLCAVKSCFRTSIVRRWKWSEKKCICMQNFLNKRLTISKVIINVITACTGTKRCKNELFSCLNFMSAESFKKNGG